MLYILHVTWGIQVAKKVTWGRLFLVSFPPRVSLYQGIVFLSSIAYIIIVSDRAMFLCILTYETYRQGSRVSRFP